MKIEHTALIDQSRLVSLVGASISWAQLERGKLDIGYRVAQAPALVISSRTANLAFQLQGAIQRGKTAVAMIQSLCPGARWFGQQVDSETIAVRREELYLRTTGPSTALAIVVDEEELQSKFPDSLDASELVDNLRRSGVSRNPTASARLRKAVRSVCFGKMPPGRVVTGTLVPLLATMLGRFDSYAVEPTDATNRRFAAVRTCERYMREHLDTSLTLLDLSRVSQMRSRTLINAFEAITGFGPMDYLKRLRLTAVHRALKRAGRSNTRVIDVATDWGFWHMGHFARDYRNMFGEAPSQTLLN
jgi:AraC family transcriptional regulator, ethanolamine operon transcriptional activator